MDKYTLLSMELSLVHQSGLTVVLSLHIPGIQLIDTVDRRWHWRSCKPTSCCNVIREDRLFKTHTTVSSLERAIHTLNYT